MRYREILYRVDEKVAVITLNRPDKLNAWTTRMAEEIQDAVMTAAADDAVNVIVITGAGRGFSAGADMSVLQNLGDGGDKKADKAEQPKPTPQDVRPDFKQPYSYFPAVPKPIIAAINGPCAGISLVLTLFCDMRIAAAEAKFTSAFVKRGLITEYGGAWLLPRIAGFGNAMDVWLTGRVFDGTEAKTLGVVNRVLPQEDFLDNAMAIAHDMANNNSPRSMRVIKQQLWESLFQDLDTALNMAHSEMKASIASDDFKEGVSHFLQKRAPRFSGE
jgi:enoyl-CoA hydratase/carnithine racemase